MKIAVVTANFGGIDKKKEIPKQTIEFDRFYIDEHNREFTFNDVNNRLAAKYYKICTHRIYSDYDVYIWLDASVHVISGNFIESFITQLGSSEIAIQKHPFRSSIYEEADFIIRSIKNGNKYLSTRYNINALLKELKFIGNGIEGLFGCGLFARVNSEKINKIFDLWFMDNLLWSAFDQFSFVRHVKAMNISIANFGDFTSNSYYKLVKHKK